MGQGPRSKEGSDRTAGTARFMDESVREKVYRDIRDKITYGYLNPGERITESDLAEKYRSSRSPIREALRQLESEGLMYSERNKGFTVSKLSVKQVEEIYNIRLLLESYAARLTAERSTKKQTNVLYRLNEKLKDAASKNILKDYIETEDLFHHFFYENCGNEHLEKILHNLHRRVHRYKYVIVSIPGHFDTYLQQHAGLLKSCSEHDGESAEKYMRSHLRAIKENLIVYLNQFPNS
jgi:DNA-binding GntR family transcriptional regulator